MPAEVKQLDLFNSGCPVLVNAVNTKGVSGCGVALKFKQKYPISIKAYEDSCKEKIVKLGIPFRILVNEDEYLKTGTRYIICFPTKVAPSREEKTKLSTIANGLSFLRNQCLQGVYSPTNTIAMPLLGCGAGGLKGKEDKVITMIENTFSEIPHKVIICVL